MNFDLIVVALGNPGPKYAFTRHNVAWIAVDLLAQEKGQAFASQGLGKKINAEVCEILIDAKKILLIKPQTFMNLSGESLAKLFAQSSHLRDVPLLCIHDEIDLPLGKVRIKLGGSDAGHNGLRSLREHLGHGDYYRIRVGVGRPPVGSPLKVVDWVLQNFEKSDEPLLQNGLEKTLNVLDCFSREGFDKAVVEASRENKK
jgi:peptidyl-tRNA hydrolase, PTH1 family